METGRGPCPPYRLRPILWQCFSDLCRSARSCAFNRIGDVLVTQGDGPGALAAYRAVLTIAEGRATCNHVNTEWQRDVSIIL